jgi:hypothetical protein
MDSSPRFVSRRFAPILFFACAAAIAPAHAQQPPAGGGRESGAGGRGRGRQAAPKSDVATARQKLLDSATPDVKDLSALITAAGDEATRRKLPSVIESPENNYVPELLAYRKEVYAPLVENAVTHDFLRGLVRKAQTAFDLTAATAAMILADAPDDGDLDALFEGYGATLPENRTTSARQLGRALGNVRARTPPPPRLAEMIERIKADAAAGKASQRGAAIEALWRAGETETALQQVEALLAKDADPLESVTVLQACSRLMQKTDVDPLLRARAVATAHATIETILADSSEITPAQAISGKGRMLRSALSFLQDVAGPYEHELVMRCLTESRPQRLLGMDGLQNVCTGLERSRDKLTPEQGTQVDDWFLKQIGEAAARLFSLEEEPMTVEEQRAFWDARDLRYNALSYFNWEIRRSKAVKARLEKEREFPEQLVTLFRAKADVKEDRDGESVYRGVNEKLENRVLALELLSNIEREFNRDPGIDLFSEALAIVASETRAGLVDPGGVLKFRKENKPHVRFEFAVVKEPADEYVKRAAIQTIANLGYVIWTGDGKIGIEVDAENPWPWERDGKPPLTPEKPEDHAASDPPAEPAQPKPEPKKDGAPGGR